jgi:hypothetical protein
VGLDEDGIALFDIENGWDPRLQHAYVRHTIALCAEQRNPGESDHQEVDEYFEYDLGEDEHPHDFLAIPKGATKEFWDLPAHTVARINKSLEEDTREWLGRQKNSNNPLARFYEELEGMYPNLKESDLAVMLIALAYPELERFNNHPDAITEHIKKVRIRVRLRQEKAASGQ